MGERHVRRQSAQERRHLPSNRHSRWQSGRAGVEQRLPRDRNQRRAGRQGRNDRQFRSQKAWHSAGVEPRSGPGWPGP